jgi:hypothetical protein
MTAFRKHAMGMRAVSLQTIAAMLESPCSKTNAKLRRIPHRRIAS